MPSFNSSNSISESILSVIVQTFKKWELLIVDDGSTDNTKNIVKNFLTDKRIKYYYQENYGPATARNYGISKCKSEWILEIDADERVSEFLSREIKEVIRISKYDYHHIPVMNYIGKDPVKFGWGAYFGKSAYPGLFKKNSKKWGFQNVHPKISFNGKQGFTLKNRLTHFYCKDIEDMFDKLNSYSDARAKDIQNLNIDENLTMNIRRLFSRFWKCFFLRKGYREKKYGFVIAIIASIYPLISFLKYKNEQKK